MVELIEFGEFVSCAGGESENSSRIFSSSVSSELLAELGEPITVDEMSCAFDIEPALFNWFRSLESICELLGKQLFMLLIIIDEELTVDEKREERRRN